MNLLVVFAHLYMYLVRMFAPGLAVLNWLVQHTHGLS